MGSHSVQRASTVSVTVLSNDCRKVVAEAVGGLGLAVGFRLSYGPFLRSATYRAYVRALAHAAGHLPLLQSPTIAPLLGHSTRLRPSLRARPTSLALLGRSTRLRPSLRARPTSLALLGAAAALRPPARVRRAVADAPPAPCVARWLTHRRLPASRGSDAVSARGGSCSMCAGGWSRRRHATAGIWWPGGTVGSAGVLLEFGEIVGDRVAVAGQDVDALGEPVALSFERGHRLGSDALEDDRVAW